MEKFRVGYLLIILLLWCSIDSSAANINFTTITVKEGLPSNTIYSIIKDKSGIMWFGTSNGLCKYDGTNFVVYRHEAGKAYALPGNEVLCLHEDKAGKLWIGTGAGGVSYYDRTKDRIIPYLGDGSWPELAHISPRAILQDHQGKLWIATYGDLRTIDLKTGKINVIRLGDATAKKGKTIVALSLLEDSKNRMWIGTNNGLYAYNPADKKLTGFINNPNDPNSLSDNVVKSIVEDKSGGVWAASLSGLNHLLPNGHFEIFKHQNNFSNSLSSDALFAMKMDKDGKIWIGTEDGVDIFDPRSASFQIMRPDPRSVFSLKSPSIRSVFIDPDGIYWIGTFGGGLAKYDKNLPLFNMKQSDPFDRSGLGSAIVNGFAEYNKNSVFVATDGAGIQLFNRETGLFTNFEIKSRLPKSRPGLTVWPLYIDHSGNLWAGTYHDGLFRVDPRTGKYEQFVADKSRDALTSNDITSIMEDDDGKFWIGTLGGGVNIYDPVSHRFTTFSQKFHQALPLNDFISCIVKSPRGKIWIASGGTGVAAFDPATQIIKHYNKTQQHLPNDIVEHLFFDSEGILWLSTEGGMCRMNERTQQVTSYTEKDGLANSIVKSILEDKTGLLWISTASGISSFNKRTGKFQNFDGENGVQQGSFSTGAAIKLSNGDIYFGGRDGFNFFNPANLQHKIGSGPVLLTELKVSNESVIPGENAPIQEQIAASKEINLKYGLNFSISYVAVNYTAPLQNQFAYRLVGFDKGWNYVHKSRVANYTNIDPGTYTFEVKASNDGEHWSAPPTSIRITVFPPFWRTRYAYAMYIFLAGLFLFLLRRRGIQKIRNEFEIQKEKMEFRQLMDSERREAEQLHELDQLKIKFLTDISHEFRTPISLILAPVEKLLRRESVGGNLEDIRMINRNVRRLLNMVNQLLDFRKLEEQELTLNLEPGDMVSFIRETGDSFKDLAAKKQITFTINSQCPYWFTSFDHNKLERVIFNLLSNAFKFTPPGGKVTLSVEVIDVPDATAHLIITVSDTGVGIPEKDITKIFDRFYQHQTNAILNQGTGIGLSIAKEFVELHGGSINAESVPGHGSSFVIDLPVLTFTSAKMAEKLPDDMQDIYFVDAPAAISGANHVEQYQESTINETVTPDRNTTILLVEDNEEFRTYLAEHLRKYYQIAEATDGKEGWQKTLSLHPQLVVSD
ncbi:two-component regulator propeller domain-containing protein, partial [Mucilaginibacter polytrichastri]